MNSDISGDRDILLVHSAVKRDRWVGPMVLRIDLSDSFFCRSVSVPSWILLRRATILCDDNAMSSILAPAVAALPASPVTSVTAGAGVLSSPEIFLLTSLMMWLIMGSSGTSSMWTSASNPFSDAHNSASMPSREPASASFSTLISSSPSTETWNCSMR